MPRLLAVAAVALLPALAPADDALLKTARAANKASLAKIQSWRGKVDFRPKTPDAKPAAGEFTRAGTQVRGRATAGTLTIEVARTGTGSRTLTLDSAAPGDQANYGEISTGTGVLPAGDPWECGLIAFPVVQGPTLLTLDEWLSANGVSGAKAGPAVLDGKPVVRVTATASQWKFEHEFDLDPAVGHLVRAHRVKNDLRPQQNGPPLPVDTTAVVTEFKEAKPGVFVPVAAGMTGTVAWKPAGYEWSAAEVAVNEPLPADAWELRFPAGLRVVDETRLGVFRTDAAGNPNEPAVSPSGVPYVYGGQMPSKPSTGPAPAAAEALDPTMLWPVALVVAAVLVVGGGLAVYLLRRK